MIVILNHAAGTAAEKAQAIEENLKQLLAEKGEQARILRPDERMDLATLVREVAADTDPLVVAGGGDGTINTVGAALAGSSKILGVLPLGTLNHFAKDLAIPFDLAGALETILRGRVVKVDVGDVNGRVFLNNSSLGLYPHIVANREAQQERLGRGKWAAFFWATLRAFRRFPFLDLKITLKGEQLVRRTAFLFVGNNEYQIEGFSLGARSCLDAGKLGLYLTHQSGRFGLLRLGLSALFGRVEQARDFNAFCVEEATIETRKPRLLVATDGEVNWLETPLHYRIRRRALRVMIPQPAK